MPLTGRFKQALKDHIIFADVVEMFINDSLMLRLFVIINRMSRK